MKKYKTIGVLGGMGPEASAYFYKLILTHAQKYRAVQDSDYPHIIVNSLNLEGSSENGMEKNDHILNQLIFGSKVLEKAGADFIVIPCNSVHNDISALKKISKFQFLAW